MSNRTSQIESKGGILCHTAAKLGKTSWIILLHLQVGVHHVLVPALGVVEMLVKFNVAEIVVALVMVHAREIVRQHVIPVALAVAHIIVPTIVRLGLDG